MTTAGPRPSHVFTDRRLGDLAGSVDEDTLRDRRAAVVDAPWTWLRQVHGATVVTVTRPGEHAGAEADGAVTTAVGAPISVRTADCAPLLLLGDGGIGVAHAGWRGLVGGIVEATAEALRALGAPPHGAVLGPCIRARCYEFGAADLDLVADRLGPTVRATTAGGAPALDVTAGIAAICASLGIELRDEGTCTACSPVHWSHRARAEPGRQALVAWLRP